MSQSDVWKNIVTQKGWQDTFLAGPDFQAYLNSEIEKTTATLKQLGIAQ